MLAEINGLPMDEHIGQPAERAAGRARRRGRGAAARGAGDRPGRHRRRLLRPVAGDRAAPPLPVAVVPRPFRRGRRPGRRGARLRRDRAPARRRRAAAQRRAHRAAAAGHRGAGRGAHGRRRTPGGRARRPRAPRGAPRRRPASSPTSRPRPARRARPGPGRPRRSSGGRIGSLRPGVRRLGTPTSTTPSSAPSPGSARSRWSGPGSTSGSGPRPSTLQRSLLPDRLPGRARPRAGGPVPRRLRRGRRRRRLVRRVRAAGRPAGAGRRRRHGQGGDAPPRAWAGCGPRCGRWRTPTRCPRRCCPGWTRCSAPPRTPTRSPPWSTCWSTRWRAARRSGEPATCRWCCAGPAGPRSWWTPGPVPPRWAGRSRARSAPSSSAPGDLLLGLTDGLVERRGDDLDEGLARLLEAVGGQDEAAGQPGRAGRPDAAARHARAGRRHRARRPVLPADRRAPPDAPDLRRRPCVSQ